MIVGINTVSSQSGRAYCADLMKNNYVIRGFTHESERGKEFVHIVNDLEGIFLDRPQNNNNEVKQFLLLGESHINHDLKEMVRDSDFIILSEPSHYFMNSVFEMKEAGLMEHRPPIVLSPSRTCATPYLWNVLGENYPIISFSTCPYSCKAPRPDTAYIKRRKRNWLASLEGEFTLAQVAKLGELFPQAIFNRKPITTSIGNIGAVFHPATYLLNFEEITRREKEGIPFSFYMEGIAKRPEVGQVLEEIDQMRLKIADTLGFKTYGLKKNPREKEWETLMKNIRSKEKEQQGLKEIRKVRQEGLRELNNSIPSCQFWLDYTYGVERLSEEKLSDAIARTPTYQKNSVPQLRYVEEDVATGLIPLCALAKRLHIDTSTADEIIALSEKLFPQRNKSADRTLVEFTDDFLIKYLKGSFFSIID